MSLARMAPMPAPRDALTAATAGQGTPSAISPLFGQRPSDSHAALAAEGVAALLDALNRRMTGDVIAALLTRAASMVNRDGLDVEREGTGLRVNGEPLHEGQPQALYRAMADHDLTKLQLAADTSPRALLQFAALLAGPIGEHAVAFDALWTEHGVWHIRVEFGGAAAGVQMEDTAAISHAGPSIEAVRMTCLAIGRGAPVGADDPAGRLLRHAPDLSAAVLFGLLSDAPHGVERRRYFEALVALNPPAGFLVTALSHHVWYVARNAADLLGAMQVTWADQALLRTLPHADSRVRAAAVRALGALGGAAALEGVRAGTRDRAAIVRREAWRALRPMFMTRSLPFPIVDEAMIHERDVAVLQELVAIVCRVPDCASTNAMQRAAARLTDRGDVPALACDLVVVLMARAPRLGLPILRRLAECSDPEIRRRVRDVERAQSHAA